MQHSSDSARASLSRLISGSLVVVLTITSCGGGDDEASSVDTAEEVIDQTQDTPLGESGDLVDNEVRDVIDDALGTDDGATVGDAISTLSPGTRYGIVAGQLDPEPEVEIDGSEIRFVFPGGSVSDAFANCMIATVVQEVGETVTLVYPDGEATC